MTDLPPDRDHEELEHIPWSMLAKELDGGRFQTKVLFGLTLVVVAVVVFAAVRNVRQTSGTVVEVPGSAVEVTPPAAADELSSPTDATAGTTTTTAPASAALYSEADLMAVAPEHEQALAAARAEWLVIDHFTVGDATDRAAAPTWVDWARAVGINATGPGEYRVAVVFSTLIRVDTGEFNRMQLRSVEIPIRIDAEGRATATDLPTPLPSDGWDAPAPPPVDLGEVPDAVIAAAIDVGRAMGSEVQVAGGSLGTDGWRVVIAVSEPGGPSVDLVVHVPG